MMLRCGTLLLSFWLSGMFLSPAHAQYYILGRGLDDNEQPYAHAFAELRGPDYYSHQTCTELGVFRFENLKAGSYELVLITSYGMRRKKIELRTSIDITLHIARNIQMDEISVVANRAGSKEPVTHSNIGLEEIRRRDFAMDMPYILEHTPSVVTTSDAGHGIGYSGLRIRGTDPTRINVTLNGIPVNDAESHNVFWVDLPDMASSTSSIQIQRGLGWSQPGTGDLGGGVHLNTLGFNYEPYAQVKIGAGSFNTQRYSAGGGTGLLRGRYTFDGRASFIRSDGYIDRAASTLWSAYGSAGYHHDQTHIKLLYTIGDELTYQAWNGVPAQYINDPALRTFNTAGTERAGMPHDNEVDDYRQSHMQLHFDQALTPFARWTSAVHYTRGKGFFEQYKAGQDLGAYGLEGSGDPSDLIHRLWLDNHFYGFTSTVHVGSPGSRYFILGGGWNTYDGDHFGEVTWTAESGTLSGILPYYRNDALKRDWNIFARSNARITERLDITTDLQGRWIRYDFEGPDRNGVITDQGVKHRFFNPKFGIRYAFGENSSVYGLTGLVHKEPNREDQINSTPMSRPRPERLWDTELGYRLQKKEFRLDITGYAMHYKDQLVLTGQLNDVGAYTRVNVSKSHRMGLETSVSFTPLNKISVHLNATLSQNRIEAFEEYIDLWVSGGQEVVSHRNTHIAFSPAIVSGLEARYHMISDQKHEINISLAGRFVGKQFVDNTSREASALNPYGLADLGIHWRIFGRKVKEIEVGLLVRNLLDHAYESNGWIYRFRSEGYDPVPDDPYAGSEGQGLYHLKGYFPQAGRHLMAHLAFRF